MWISKAVYTRMNALLDAAQHLNNELRKDEATILAENAALKAELTRHVADKDWFKHRLNQVEMERAQLIYAATGGSGRATEGVKIAAPQFAMGPPAGTVSETLNEQYNPFGSTGDDSRDPADQIPGHVEDLTHMPGYSG